MHPTYDTSPPARANFATGNPHFDCAKFGPEDAMFLCYLAGDRDPDSAEAALDRLRLLLPVPQIAPHLVHVYQTALLVELGSDDVTVRAAARELRLGMKSLAVNAQRPAEVALAQSTGSSKLDGLLGRVLADLSDAFSERLLSCYAVGSAFDGSGVASSDIDLHVLLKGAHSSCVKQALQEFSKQLSTKHGVDLDLVPFFESDITPWADVRTKLGGLQIFGDCSNDRLVLPPMDDYVRESMHRAYYYLARVRDFPDSLSYPVSAPHAERRFLGYDLRVHEDGSPSTKELVVVAGWVSTALLARAARVYVASKSTSFAGYLEHVSDEWTPHLRDIFLLSREKWNYRIPESKAEQEKLAQLCIAEVEFENHFLRVYRDFLEAESAGAASPHRERAAKLLTELFPAPGREPTAKDRLLVPAWQLSTKRQELNPRLTSVDHLIVKTESLQGLSDKTLRQAYQRFDEFGVVIFACRDTLNLKYELLALQRYFGQVIFHPRSDSTGISSVRNQFTPQCGFVGTTNVSQTMHTDGSFRQSPPGIVALQTEICGLSGGASALVFGEALYRHMERSHPEDLEKLFQPDAYTIGREGESCTRPVFWREQGRVHLAFRCGNGEHLEIAPWARRGFHEIYDFVNAPANQLRFRLPTDHVLVVDNRRNLHGRLGWPHDTVRSLNRLWLDGLASHSHYPGLGIRL